MKLYINSFLVGLVTFVWASTAWLGNFTEVNRLVSLDQPKPWVYRQLVSTLARLLSQTGLRIDYALILVITLSGVLFYWSLRKLYFGFYSRTDKNELYVLGVVFVGLGLFGYSRTPYDLMTAFTFTLSLYYILSGQNLEYLVIFILACLNRETSVILILVYVVYWFYYSIKLAGKVLWFIWKMTACQIYIYGLITYCLRVIFQYNDGLSVWIRPTQNLVSYVHHPYITLLHIVVFGFILWMVFRGWKYKPIAIRLAFMIMAPILFVMFLVCGYPFELRVFWETYPLVVMLM